MPDAHRVRHYKGFEIRPAYGRWAVCWRTANDDACSLAQRYPSIAAAKRAINDQLKLGLLRPKRAKRIGR